MVFIARFLSAAAVITFAAAIPMPVEDSALGEVAVSAPNGTPISDTAELAQETALSSTQVVPEPQVTAPPPSNNYDQYQPGSDNSGYGSSKGKGGSKGKGDSKEYGSGSSNWGDSGYNNCVQQCVASYGSAPYEYKPTGTSDPTGYGNGATHTVIVAPTQGVLRYVPFALNASVGDTVKFIWGANNHTVTKSSALLPCNKSGDALFTSGTHDKGFEFTQVVNSTEPTFYYCGTPTHCQKGMFGIINPPVAFGAPTSVDVMASDMAASDYDIAAMWSSTDSATKGNYKAASWGGNIDSKDMPDWSKKDLLKNTMYVRNFLAANPDVLKENGSIDLSNAANTPLNFPQDFSAAVSYGSPPAASAPATPSTAASASPLPTASAGATAANAVSNGGNSISSPKILVGLMVAFATFFAL